MVKFNLLSCCNSHPETATWEYPIGNIVRKKLPLIETKTGSLSIWTYQLPEETKFHFFCFCVAFEKSKECKVKRLLISSSGDQQKEIDKINK